MCLLGAFEVSQELTPDVERSICCTVWPKCNQKHSSPSHRGKRGSSEDICCLCLTCQTIKNLQECKMALCSFSFFLSFENLQMQSVLLKVKSGSLMGLFLRYYHGTVCFRVLQFLPRTKSFKSNCVS